MARFSIADINSLMSAVSIAYNMAVRKQAKEYWNDLALRLNELAKEMEEERQKDLLQRVIRNENHTDS